MLPIRDISNIPNTPRRGKSTRISTKITDPLTPTKRQMEDPFTPRKKPSIDSTTSDSEQFGLLTPQSTPSKSRSPALVQSNTTGVKRLFTNCIYSQAKELFQRGSLNTSLTPYLVGREEECKVLSDFFINNIISSRSESLYVSGPPGSGKTAQISKLIKYIQGNPTQVQSKTFKIININCMVINNPASIFQEILCQIQSKLSLGGHGRKPTCSDLHQFLKNSDNKFDHVVVILDELDHLITKDQQVLFELFNLVSNEDLSTKMLLVGISNALDLTDKFLPRLKRNGINPKTLAFMPYTSDQIKLIIQTKLKELPQELFHPAAIQLCSKKAGAITGDLRKAFDICYKSIELVQLSSTQQDGTQKVMISHVAKICSNSFGNNTLTRLSNLNLLQKVVLCCLYKCEQQMTINGFYEFYKDYTLTKAGNLISVLNRGEFLEIISALESLAIINTSVSKTKTKCTNMDVGTKMVSMNIPHQDLLKSVGDIGVLQKLVH